MGWRIRFTGGTSKRKHSIDVVSPLRYDQLTFEKNTVYHLAALEARELISAYPDSFERVLADDDGYADAAPIRDDSIPVVPDPDDRQQRRKGRIRAIQTTTLSDGGPSQQIVVGAEIEVGYDKARDLIARYPNDFEWADDTASEETTSLPHGAPSRP